MTEAKNRTCTIAGCVEKLLARGMCGAHYQKWRTLGDPLNGGTRAKNGSGYIDADGYHRRHENGVEKPEHVRIVERAIGKPLPVGAVVHHADRNRSNNTPSNLVVCPSSAYHNLLHKRLRAMEATGDPNSLKCCRCGKYDSSTNLRISKKQAYHLACNAQHVRNQNAKKKGVSL